MLKDRLIVALVSVFMALPVFVQQPAVRLATWDYPPYIIKSGDSAQGLTVEIVSEVFRRAGREIEYEFYPFARAMSMVTTGGVDGLFTIKKNAKREANLLFPKETIIEQDYVFFVLKESKVEFDGNFSSMANASIGVVNQTSYGDRFDKAAKNGAFKKLDVASNYELTFRKLLVGRMDAVICIAVDWSV